MSRGKKSTWGAFPPPPHPTLIAGGLSPGRKGLPLTELLRTHAQAPRRFLLQIHGLPSVLAGAPSKPKDNPGVRELLRFHLAEMKALGFSIPKWLEKDLAETRSSGLNIYHTEESKCGSPNHLHQ